MRYPSVFHQKIIIFKRGLPVKKTGGFMRNDQYDENDQNLTCFILELIKG